MPLRITGVKFVMFKERGRPSLGTVTVLASPADVTAWIEPSGLHVSIGDDPAWQRRAVLNEEIATQLLTWAGVKIR